MRDEDEKTRRGTNRATISTMVSFRIPSFKPVGVPLNHHARLPAGRFESWSAIYCHPGDVVMGLCSRVGPGRREPSNPSPSPSTARSLALSLSLYLSPTLSLLPASLSIFPLYGTIALALLVVLEPPHCPSRTQVRNKAGRVLRTRTEHPRYFGSCFQRPPKHGSLHPAFPGDFSCCSGPGHD